MRLQLNPLTVVLLILVYIFSLFSSNSLMHYFIHFITLILFGYFFSVSFTGIKNRVRPIIVFIPFMTILYCLFSMLLSTEPIFEVFQQAFRAVIKILLLLISTSTFLELISSSRLMDAIRTQWISLNIKWRIIEDFFQLIDLSLRFFPLVSSETKILIEVDKMLGFSKPKTKIARIKKIANYLPSLLLCCMQRAGQIGESMESRGYGKVIPRTIAKPVHFGFNDGLLIVIIIAFLIGRVIFAKL